MGLDIYLYKIKKYDVSSEESRIDLINCDTLQIDRKGFPEWTKSFEVEITDNLFDIKKVAELYGLDFDKMRIEISFSDSLTFFDNNKEVTILIDDIPTNMMKFPVLGYDEIGSQGRGVSTNFYDEYDNDDYCIYIWTLDEAIKLKEKYIEPDMREYFQTHILNNFIEGETVIYISW